MFTTRPDVAEPHLNGPGGDQGFDLSAIDPIGADFVHPVVQCAKLAYADREAFYGEPHFVRVPLGTLLSEDYNAPRRRLVGVIAPDGKGRRLVRGTVFRSAAGSRADVRRRQPARDAGLRGRAVMLSRPRAASRAARH